MKKLIKSILLAIFLLHGGTVWAVSQLPDYVIYKGDTVPINSQILEQYFEAHKKSDFRRLFQSKFITCHAGDNCFRGYQAIYSIENDSLFLNNIISCGSINHPPINKNKSQRLIKEIFGRKVKRGKVFLGWYTGEFSWQKGKLLRQVWSYYTIYSKGTLFKVKKGKVKNISEISNYIDKSDGISRRYHDTISNVLFEDLEKIKWKSTDEFDCSAKYLITIGKNGKISNVSMVNYQSKDTIKAYWDRKEYNYCIRTVSKGLRNLKFDILKRNGKPIKENVIVDIFFDNDSTLENWTYQ